jgi:Transposase family tnp2
MLSFDGAQLYAHKASDCWIIISVIFDHAPDTHYKKAQVLVVAIIPGPHKPRNMDSILFPSLYHLAALQHEGLTIWDAWRNQLFITKPFLALATADGPAMAYLNGLVSHQGKYVCCLYCPVMGWHKPGSPHYYPTLLKPHNYNVEGCNHNDISHTNLSSCSLEKYYNNLHHLMSSPNETQYKKRCLETGISKPSIFLSLQEVKTLCVPSCFGLDIMHLLSLNIPALLVNLWWGMLDCDKSDDCTTWDWATLRGNVWEMHGQQVTNATPYLPGSFDHPPCNPAEKISSGYKAWEFLMHLFGLGSRLLYNVLPEKYWKIFCKLVYGG